MNLIVKMIQGALIGTGAVLPGISGGVLCVLFGIYQQIMALLVHPFKTLKESWKTLLPVLIGVAAGFLGIAKLLGVVLAGLSADSGDITAASALALSLGIALQNLPEGAIISMPLKSNGIFTTRYFKPFWLAVSSVSPTLETSGLV